MVFIGRNIKVWIFITLCSLLIWILYWIPAGIGRFFGMDGTPWNILLQYVGIMFFIFEMSGAIGMFFRFGAVILAILSLFFLIKETRTVLDIKKWIAISLFLESIYYLLLLPSGLFMVGVGNDFIEYLNSVLLGVDYLLMVLFTAPFLLILGFKVYKYEGGTEGFNSWTWASFTFVGYIASLWVNSVIKWIDMVSFEGLSFFFSGIRSIGALNAFVLMSLALFFSVIGAHALAKKNFSSAIRWVGATLILIGLHYAIFLVYSYAVGLSSFLMLSEIWAIPLLGLGLSMLKIKN